ASWSVSASAVAYGDEFMQNRHSTTVDIDDDMRFVVRLQQGTFSLYLEFNKHMLYALAEDLLVRLANILYFVEDYKFLVLNEWAPVSGKCMILEGNPKITPIGMREKRDTSKDITKEVGFRNETVEVASMGQTYGVNLGYDVRKWQPLDNCEEADSMPFRFL
ncbi:hypothetical protein ACJX0J_013279, partial [Zea mays]